MQQLWQWYNCAENGKVLESMHFKYVADVRYFCVPQFLIEQVFLSHSQHPKHNVPFHVCGCRKDQNRNDLGFSNSTAIAASGIAFKMCQDSMCKRAIGRKAMIVGGKAPKRCPFGTYGQKYLVCGRDDVSPAWIKDESMCLKKHSPKGVAFIDTGYHFKGMRVEKIENMELVSRMEIPEHLTVWKDQITFPYAVEKEGDTVSVDAVLRFTVEEEIGRYVNKKMAAYTDVYASYLRKRMGEAIGVDDVTVSSAPHLYLPVAWSNIVTIIVVVLVVILAFLCGLYIMYYHFRPKSQSSVKKLTRTKDSDGLLANSVWCVCSANEPVDSVLSLKCELMADYEIQLDGLYQSEYI